MSAVDSFRILTSSQAAYGLFVLAGLAFFFYFGA